MIKILREIAQETGSSSVDYARFKSQLAVAPLIPTQKIPLNQRMGLLESFLQMEPEPSGYGRRRNAARALETPEWLEEMWKFEKGSLTIVDLSCPFVSANEACALFNICLSIFLKDRGSGSRIIALDEAHKVRNMYLHSIGIPVLTRAVPHDDGARGDGTDGEPAEHHPAAAAPGDARGHRHAGTDAVAHAARPVRRDDGAPVHLAGLVHGPGGSPGGRGGGRVGAGPVHGEPGTPVCADSRTGDG